jgi:hypothetical protein
LGHRSRSSLASVLHRAARAERRRAAAWLIAGIVTAAGAMIPGSAEGAIVAAATGLALSVRSVRQVIGIQLARRDFQRAENPTRRAHVVLLDDPNVKEFRPLLAVWRDAPPPGGRLRNRRASGDATTSSTSSSRFGARSRCARRLDTGPRSWSTPRWVRTDAGIALPHRRAWLGRWYLYGGAVMAAANNQQPTRSALFVDFDNVYIGLRNLDPHAAERFAADPRPWLAWIEEGMPGREDPRLGDLGDRLVLIRRCYLNPVAFAAHRPVFTRAGFSVIDCPPLTAQGKTSTDIHMVMDILDTLRDYEHISEYIVLSGDADFTPVLLRLRAHDRRTVVLPVGPAAAAFRASADRVLAENDFVDIALGGRTPVGEEESAALAELEDITDRAALDPRLGDLRQELLDEVRRIVDAAPRALRLAAVAHDVRAKFKAAIDETDWARAGSFTSLLRSADNLGLTVTGGGGGYVFDPARHEPPAAAGPDPLSAFGEELGGLVARVSQVTDTPILTGEQYRHVFEVLADYLRSNHYEISPTSKAVRDACGELGDRTSRQSINFILKGIAYRNGFRPGVPNDAASLASVYADNVLELAAAAQLPLTQQERERVVDWLTGGLR